MVGCFTSSGKYSAAVADMCEVTVNGSYTKYEGTAMFMVLSPRKELAYTNEHHCSIQYLP